jgi:hypothetical protein
MDAVELFRSRKAFSKGKLTALRAGLAESQPVSSLSELCIYATGSYGRGEASDYSDVDLFFVQAGSQESNAISRLDMIKLFSSVVQIADALDFPAFSNDGEYLWILYTDDIRDMLGGREDDHQNVFTARMLLLLESSPLFNDKMYQQLVENIVGAYYRDYPDHAQDFRPVFLINDILRYWKTLCLNYEHRRNKPDDNKEAKRKQQIKNFKLKYSRLLSCFGTVIAVCAKAAPITKEAILALTTQSPLERFLSATEGASGLNGLRDSVIEDYAWFMNLTALSTEELGERFSLKTERKVLFERADAFGQSIYSVLNVFAQQNGYSRYLII